MTKHPRDISDDVAALRSSLNLVDHAVASALGRVRAQVEPAVARFGRRWLVACSGGADSLVMLATLVLLRRRFDLELFAAHVDHGLRVGSTEEGEGVLRISAALETPCHALQVTLAPGAGLAARARDARHEALDRCAAELGAGVIALGHTATDRAETLLLNLARGAGIGGLSAMPSQDHRHVRPLLDFSREEVRGLALRMRLPFVDDPTNDRDDLPRTSIRHRVLPVLEAQHAGADRRIAATAAELEEVKEAMDEWVDRELKARACGAPVGVTAQEVSASCNLAPTERRSDPVALGMTLTGWAMLPKAIRVRMLRTFLVASGVDGSALGRDVVESIDAVCCRVHGPDARSAARGERRSHTPPNRSSTAELPASSCVDGARWSVRPNLRVCVRQGTLRVEASHAPTSQP